MTRTVSALALLLLLLGAGLAILDPFGWRSPSRGPEVVDPRGLGPEPRNGDPAGTSPVEIGPRGTENVKDDRRGGHPAHPDPVKSDPSAIVGVVTHAISGEPLEGARLRATAISAEAGAVPAGDPPPPDAEVISQADGTFRLPWPTKARCDLTASAIGHVAEKRGGIGAGEVIAIRLRPGIEIRGFVTRRSDGAPLRDAWVRLLPARPLAAGDTLLLPPAVKTGADGRFAIAGAPKIDLRVRAHHARCMSGDVVLPAGDVGPANLVLTPALVAWFRVRTEDGGTARGVRVTHDVLGNPGSHGGALLDDRLQGEGESEEEATGATDALGPIRVPCIGTDVTFVLTAAGYLPWTRESEPLPAAGDVRVYDASIAPDPAVGRLRIRLADTDGAALSATDARVVARLSRSDGGALGTTGFEVRDGDVYFGALPAGRFHAVLASPGRAPAVIDAAVEERSESVAKAQFGREARLTIRIEVVGVKGRRKVRFRLTREGQAVIAFPTTEGGTREAGEDPRAPTFFADSEGTTLGGLGDADYEVEVLSPDLRAPPTRVRTEVGATREVTVSARPK